MKRLSWLPAMLFAAGAIHAQSAYRWVDEQGKVHYSDRPPQTASGKVEQRQLNAPAADKQPAFAMRRAMADYPVTLYISSDCGDSCRQAVDFLRKRGVPFSEKSVSTQENLAALSKLTAGEARVPVMQVGNRVLKGFESAGWSTLLDAAGYP